MTAVTPASTAVVSNRVPEPGPDERLDHFLTNKVAASLQPLLYGARGITTEMILKLTMMAVHESTRLAECTLPSIALALHKVARLRLVIGETIYLVPLKNGKTGKMECQAWVGYQGKMQLAMESNLCRDMVAYVVHNTDKFSWHYGLNETCDHAVNAVPLPAGQKKVITHAWVRITKRYGVVTFWVMEYADIYARMKASKNPDINKLDVVPGWYAQKTVINDWLNRQPKNARLAEAMADPDPELDGRISGSVVEGAVDGRPEGVDADGVVAS